MFILLIVCRGLDLIRYHPPLRHKMALTRKPTTPAPHPNSCVTGKLKRMLPGTKSALSEASEGHADVRFCDGDKFRFGTR